MDKTTNLDAVDQILEIFTWLFAHPVGEIFCLISHGTHGFIAWRSTKNFDDYILGGHSLGPFVTALSAGASDMSGWLLMGLPGAIFISGICKAGLPLA
ncbi:sodium:solute symporter family transporter [Escherichia coli]